ncbi:MAG: outer membrane protein assembly factor BamA [Alphaproteobacteria bacterium]|nr:outer membrane protein assembly factor BamA [Alphaproteobacteria bacterium]
MERIVRAGALWACLVVAAVLGFPAQAQEGGTVGRIVVEGIQRIEPETVRSYMAIREGDAYDPSKLDQSLKALFATGLFADVTLRREGADLIVRVVENPIINRIAFEGNKKLEDKVLSREAQLRPRVVYTRTKVQSDVKRILDLYRRSGRFAATVEPKIIQLEQNRVDLVFEINEGAPTYVQSVAFVGNRQYGDSKLRDIIQTKEERWYRFFTQDDTYDPDRLTYDRELMRRFYLAHGYADFQVKSVVAELTPDRQGFFITFTIEEGERYRVGKTDLRVAIKDLDVEELRPLVKPQEGAWYSADDVEDTVQALTEAVGNKGYAFVDVTPKVDRKRADKVVDLIFDVREGPRVFVERIDITGNVRTLDKVIRREFRLVEGDAFNSAKLRRSRQRVRDLNFFQKVDITTQPAETAADRTVIKVDVEEKSTGELTFGVGWSTSAGAMMEVGLRERNLLGRGQDLKLSTTIAERQSQLDFAFTEPYFMDRRLAAGVDLYALTRELQEESSYDASSIGGALRMGYQINEGWRQDWRYLLSRDKVENVQDDASRFIKEQEGTAIISLVAHTITYDKRDSRLDPTEGYYVRLTTELAGLGGTEHFLRNGVGAGYFLPLGDGWIVGLGGSAGHVVGINDDVRITNRYFLGGDSLRGFATAGVSPRDTATGDALGGLWMFSGTVELTVPLGLPPELGLTGRVFTDLGSIGETDETVTAGLSQSTSIRSSIGAGVKWRSPVGPINVDLGLPILKEDFDKTEIFRLNFGTRF